MAISKIGGTGSDNWELISSVTPTGGAAAVNFTGLSPYKKLMLVWDDVVLTTAQNFLIRVNNDSGFKYFTQWTTTSSIGLDQGSRWFIGGTGGENHTGYIIFSSADNAGVKLLDYGAEIGGANFAYFQGYYLASAVVSQVNFYSSSTFTAVGTVALYGVK
jgi:hypothetical protein